MPPEVSDMVRELAVAGAWEIAPKQHRDARALFYEWFTHQQFSGFAGHCLDLRQPIARSQPPAYLAST
jgi:dTDP-4-dehydrorhamnose 3,5-epimerase-like enzyme